MRFRLIVSARGFRLRRKYRLNLNEDFIQVGLAARKDEYHPALERFFDVLPSKPYCGDMKPAYLIRSKRHALRWNYIQASPPGLAAWLTFDIDHANCWIWEDAGLPSPNLIVRDKMTGTSHISYAIAPVCTSSKGRSHPKRFMEAIRKAFVRRLKADPEYTGRITKNPFSAYWDTTVLHGEEYSLGELAESLDLVDLSPPPFALVADESHCPGRNSILFQRLRFWAYRHVDSHRETGTYQEWSTRIQQQAERFNDFRDTDFASRGALGVKEVDATSRSVTRWTWDNYKAPQARGVMQLQDSEIDLASKQRLSAQRTHKIRSESTATAVREAIDKLTRAGSRVSKAAVSRLTGVSRQQISRRYGYIFGELATERKSVTYGVHQILAPKGLAATKTEEIVARSVDEKRIERKIDSSSKDGIEEPRSGRVSAKDNQFKSLCVLLASMARIAHQDGAAVQLNYSDRGRLARCLLAQGLSKDDTELIAMDVSARSVESQYSHMSIDAWVGYVIEYGRKLKQDNLYKEEARKKRFDDYLQGDTVKLHDSELGALLAHQNAKQK